MILLLYSLHSGNLYGTERMALMTAQGLEPEFRTVIIAPSGPVHEEARRMGFETVVFRGLGPYLRDLRKYYAKNKKVVAVGTRVVHSLTAAVWQRVYLREGANLQVVHGGADERLSYGRKRLLHYFGVKQVAVSDFVRDRLLKNGSHAESIRVIENFLDPARIKHSLRRPRYSKNGIRRVLIVSRLDPIKRIDLLMDAIDCDPGLRELEFRVLGSGSEEQRLRERARRNYPNVEIVGFSTRTEEELASADLLLHLCPEEPFGISLLEAMAARLPILVADTGGASTVVEPGVSGLHFRANDAQSLAEQLQSLRTAPAETMNNLADAAAARLSRRYTASHGAAQYRQLIQECWA